MDCADAGIKTSAENSTDSRNIVLILNCIMAFLFGLMIQNCTLFDP
ncbi:hypothetical protein A33Q_3648 [Indibacter alkaliphilus LW1]|uniref:Uncharacterized protein n=1 Tax=Indibacter alkaliphilus (strain CCUG 57479 / KCTC 22604 / LW1) TaxID=1189612 RepID=S2D322_INDAL|nr:hypothetical protein A33Q_3648 [Indibacter alkaliphilus LW1]